MVLTPTGTGTNPDAGLFWDTNASNVSVRAQLRLTDTSNNVVIWSCGYPRSIPLSETFSYFAGVAGQTQLVVRQGIPNTSDEQFASLPLPFDMTQDFMLQLDTVDTMVQAGVFRDGTPNLVPGVQLDVWLWRPGDPMPSDPFFTVFDTSDIL